MLLISYHSKHNATRKSGLLLDDNRDVSEVCVTRPLVEIALLQIMAETGQLIPRKGWNFCEGKTTLKVPISAKRGIPHCQADLVRQAMPVVINYNINNSLKLKS